MPMTTRGHSWKSSTPAPPSRDHKSPRRANIDARPADDHITPEQQPHNRHAWRAATVRPAARPLSRLPAKTGPWGVPPPFPTTLPPQGDPETVVGNGSGG